ncbi:MAG: OmpA family protein [candidate division KSB1 bacterium]|jgi:outer membrane protein OmpA-like peptidoglycan-associated protein|nr:OmpA family protein [candidate division KSB1 bacterium]
MRLRSIIASIIIIFSSTTTIHGYTWDNTKGVGLTLNTIKFIGDQTDKAAIGSWSGIKLSYGLSPYVKIQANASYGSFKPSVAGSRFKPDSDSPYRTFNFPVSVAIQASPVKEGRLKPYLMLGAGMMLWDLRDVSTVKDSFFDQRKFRWGQRIHGPLQKNPMLTQGIGAELFFTDNLTMDIYAIFSALIETTKDNVGLGDFNDQVVQGGVALTYYFGTYKDTDNDGIEDKYDASPLHAEDFDGYQDKDGEPDFDNDGDGIPDLKDEAPDVAEDFDNFQDDDGIPDLDNDGDGIIDARDACPDDAEDFDGFNDNDGCPDNDNDGDGIMDDVDKCPDESETINGYEDTDGCPDSKPVEKLKRMEKLEKQGARLIMRGVNFASGSSALTVNSYSILDEIALQLHGDSEVMIEIRGYTDSSGSAAANQALSERRARAVMQYLINAGIDPARMKAAGFGEKDPVSSNDTVQGRAQNRRIEFVRIK